MPLTDPAARGRCTIHISHSAVGTCAGCGRTMCLECSIPVRGEIYGPECLEPILGPGAVDDPGPARRGRPAALPIGIAFGVATLSTALPWKRFGLGSGPFGAYGLVARWSWLAAVGALAGLMLWGVVSFRTEPPRRRWYVALCATGVITTVGSIASIISPGGFGPLGPGPFVGALAGVTAAALCGRAARSWSPVMAPTTSREGAPAAADAPGAS